MLGYISIITMRNGELSFRDATDYVVEVNNRIKWTRPEAFIPRPLIRLLQEDLQHRLDCKIDIEYGIGRDFSFRFHSPVNVKKVRAHPMPFIISLRQVNEQLERDGQDCVLSLQNWCPRDALDAVHWILGALHNRTFGVYIELNGIAWRPPALRSPYSPIPPSSSERQPSSARMPGSERGTWPGGFKKGKI